MNAQAILANLRERRVELRFEAGELRYHAPRGAFADADRAMIRLHKAEILTLLACGAPAREIAPGDWVIVAKPAELVCSKLGRPVEIVYPPDCGNASCVQGWSCACPVTRPGHFTADTALIVQTVRRPPGSEAWAVVSTGKAYPLAWLQRIGANDGALPPDLRR